MKLLSVNIGKEQSIRNGKQSGKTGIFKMPTDAAVHISSLGLQGDHIDDKKNHGGVDQAVYVFGAADYAWWSKTLGRDLEPGTFGDNLTISDLESAHIRVGNRLRVGEVLLEVTGGRIPCVTLAARMEDPKFVKRFRAAERPGLYCRVIETGMVRAGDPVSLEPYQGETLTAIELFRLYYDNEADVSEIRRALAAPIAIRARNDFEERLAALLAN
jgi:MOSC domain-containing protein YiiM